MDKMFAEDYEAEILRLRVLCEVTGSLLAEVPPNLRQVQFQYTSTSIHLISYFDGIPTDDEEMNLSSIDANLIASLYPEFMVSHTIHSLEYPLPIPPVDLKNGGYAYARKEKLDSYNFMDQLSALIYKE